MVKIQSVKCEVQSTKVKVQSVKIKVQSVMVKIQSVKCEVQSVNVPQSGHLFQKSVNLTLVLIHLERNTAINHVTFSHNTTNISTCTCIHMYTRTVNNKHLLVP